MLISNARFSLVGSPGKRIGLCLNYVEGGFCLLDGSPCLLGTRGSEARNEERACPRQGSFDVWRTKEDLILISDLEGPYEGVKDCYGLGISVEEAAKVAQRQAQSAHTRIVTTQRKCAKCGERFWPRGKFAERSPPGRAAGYFCASCLGTASQAELDQYWKEVGSASEDSHVDLSEWCG